MQLMDMNDAWRAENEQLRELLKELVKVVLYSSEQVRQQWFDAVVKRLLGRE